MKGTKTLDWQHMHFIATIFFLQQKTLENCKPHKGKKKLQKERGKTYCCLYFTDIPPEEPLSDFKPVRHRLNQGSLI